MYFSKTTAINGYNTAVIKQSGRIGTVRYYNKNGLTYVRAASNSQVTNNRTNAQMTQRLTIASLAALYSTMGKHLRGAFVNKAKNQNDYNAFIQANQGEGVFLTKQNRALNHSVALPVIIALGKLPEIKGSIVGSNVVSNLKVGTLDMTTAKVSDLSTAIIASNEDWSYDDQLTIVVLRQVETFCKPQYVKIILRREDETPLSALGSFMVVEGCLAFAASGDICAGFVHSSPFGGMSRCELTASDSMIAIIHSYLTPEVFAAASASYGKSTETFLIPSKSRTSGSSVSGSTNNGSSSSANTGGGSGTPSGGTGGGTSAGGEGGEDEIG